MDVYSIFTAVAVAATWVTRPHVVTPDELRLRSGAFFDLRIPRHTVASVRLTRCFNESSAVAVAGDRLDTYPEPTAGTGAGACSGVSASGSVPIARSKQESMSSTRAVSQSRRHSPTTAHAPTSASDAAV